MARVKKPSTGPPPRPRRSQRKANSSQQAEEQAPPQPRRRSERKANSLGETEEQAPPQPRKRQRKADSLRKAERQATKAMLALDSECPRRRYRSSRIEQLREECADMELNEDEFTEEQLQAMTDYHATYQTSVFAPSWVKSVAQRQGGQFPRRPHSVGGATMCAPTGGSNIGKRKKLQYYDLLNFSSKKIRAIRFCDVEFWFPLLKEPDTK